MSESKADPAGDGNDDWTPEMRDVHERTARQQDSLDAKREREGKRRCIVARDPLCPAAGIRLSQKPTPLEAASAICELSKILASQFLDSAQLIESVAGAIKLHLVAEAGELTAIENGEDGCKEHLGVDDEGRPSDDIIRPEEWQILAALEREPFFEQMHSRIEDRAQRALRAWRLVVTDPDVGGADGVYEQAHLFLEAMVAASKFIVQTRRSAGDLSAPFDEHGPTRMIERENSPEAIKHGAERAVEHARKWWPELTPAVISNEDLTGLLKTQASPKISATKSFKSWNTTLVRLGLRCSRDSFEMPETMRKKAPAAGRARAAFFGAGPTTKRQNSD
jgi:hypothetical protein